MNRRIEIEGSKKNLSRAFILPMVGINYKNLPSNFINCYIKVDNENYYCMLVFDKTRDYDEIFYHFMNNIHTNNKHLLKYDDLEEEVIFIFKIPEILKEDFKFFMDGKYSKFSEEYKKVLCNFFGRKSKQEDYTVTEYNAIYPEDFKRKQIASYLSYENSEIDWKLIKEVLHRPDLEREIFKSIDVLLSKNLTI